MFLNKEFLHLYEELSNLNGDLEEKFDTPGAEVIYGEEATTIAGVLRYFVEDIPTLAAIINRGRIKASQQKETDTNSPLGDKNYKRRSFVSFSRQLFSHAYRAPKKWKYGIAVDQKALEKKAQQMPNTNICPDFDHPGNNMLVYGATKLEDGTELLVTSFGSFIMNLNEQTRNLLKQHQNVSVEKTAFYDDVKNFFDAYIKEMSDKKQDTNIAYTSEIAKIEELVKKRRRLDSPIVEGFVLLSSYRTHALAPRFTDLCLKVPGLFEYLKEHTNLNEGEFRIWVAEGQQYLDISDCIVGVVLPSNYKENNLDNEQNTAPDVLWLRKLIKEQNLTVYVYKSDEETNIPSLDTSAKRRNRLERPSVMEYFHKITSSREAVINFIQAEMAHYNVKAQSAYGHTYVMAMAKNTTSDQLDINQNNLYNYKAFLAAIEEFGFNNKDVASIYHTGQPLVNAISHFEKVTSSVEEIQNFLQQVVREFPNKNLNDAYTSWFGTYTNAYKLNAHILEPAEVMWDKFTATCKSKFNLTGLDLTALSQGQKPEINRESIKNLFKAATTSKKATIEFIKKFAAYAANYSHPTLSGAYHGYMGKMASDTNTGSLSRDPQYNYMMWLNKVTDPKGTVKFKKEEVLAYFKDFIANTNNK